MNTKAFAATLLIAISTVAPAQAATRTFEFTGTQTAGVQGLGTQLTGQFTLDYDAPPTSVSSPGTFDRSDYLALKTFELTLGQSSFSFAGAGQVRVLNVIPGLGGDLVAIELTNGIVSSNLSPSLIGTSGISLQLVGPSNLLSSTSIPTNFDAFESRSLQIEFRVGAIYAARIDSLAQQAAAIPEPETWALMVGGFGLIGAASRRRSIADSAERNEA